MFKKIKQIVLFPAILLVVLVVSGCDDAQTVSHAELEKAKSEWQEPKVSTWYYMGSKGGYHYFTLVDLPEAKVYRIREIEMIRKSRFPLTRNQEKWKLMPWGIHSPERTTRK